MQQLEFRSRELARLKACVKATILSQPELAPRLGRFVLVRLLGEGANGAVYEAHDTRDGSSVALKILRAPDAANVARFKREFRGLAHLSHASLVALYELFADSDEWFFSMELVAGVPFVDYARDPLSAYALCNVDRLRKTSRELLSAVQAIHDAGRLHCDLKPSNVLVTAGGRVVVLDFGLLTRRGDASPGPQSEVQSGPLGTFSYMAPELRAGGRPTPASDGYAIGMMLFRSLYGTSREPSRPDGELDPALERVCAGLLADDPNARMTIDAAREQLGGQAGDSRSWLQHAPAVTRFFGRAAELERVRRAFAEVVERRTPRALFVAGPSGIGKSALCDRLAAELEPHALVLRGRCHERESLPYKAFDGIIDGLGRALRNRAELAPRSADGGDALGCAALVRVFPSLADCLPRPAGEPEAIATSDTELRARAFVYLKSLLNQHAPLVVIADDLQWADLDSARLLFELLGPPHAPALLYIGCYRSEEASASEFLTEVVGGAADARWQCARECVPLGVLPSADSIALAHALLAGSVRDSASTARRIAHEADGVPLFVSELARFCATQSEQSESAPSLLDLLRDRIAALDPKARRALDLLALAARPVPAELLGLALTQWPRLEQERALHTLRVLGLVREAAGQHWVVYHDRLQEEATRMLSRQDAQALHRTLAGAYEALGDSEPERSIEHWYGAGETGRALEHAAAAARRAAHKLAFNRAAALYQKALELGASDDPRRAQWHAQAGEALANAGRSADAAAAFLSAAGTDAGAALALRCRALQQYLRCGKRAQGDALLETLMHEVGLPHPHTRAGLISQILLSRARLLVQTVRSGHAARSRVDSRRGLVLEAVFRECSISDPMRGALLQGLFHEQALRSRDPLAIFMALAWDAYSYTFVNAYSGRRGTARRIAKLTELAAALRTPYTDATLSFVRCAAAVYESRYREADGHGTHAERIFRDQCPGAYWEESMCAALRFSVTEITGPLDSLVDEAPKLLRRAHESADEFTQTMLSRIMSQSLLAQDRADEAVTFLASRPLRAGAKLDVPRWFVALSMNDALCYAGRVSEAWQRFDETWREFRRSPLYQAKFLRYTSLERHARSALRMGRLSGDPAFFRIVAHDVRALEAFQWPDADGAAWALRAALCVQRGQRSEATQWMRRASAVVSGVGATLISLAADRVVALLEVAGASRLADIDAGLRAGGVTNPARWTDLFLPGFGDAP